MATTDPDSRLWTQLTSLQADGRACVMCEQSTAQPGWTGRPVGRSRTGSQVFACAGPCVELAAMTREEPTE